MDSRKVFCFVSPNFFQDHKGGTEIQTFLLAKELIKRGWETHFIRENSQKLGQEDVVEEIRVHSLPKKPTRATWLNSFHLKKIMKKIQADVWYCRAGLTYLFPVWRIARRHGQKVIWACSNDIYVSQNLGKKKKDKSLLLRLASDLDRYLFLKALRKIPLIIVQTHHQKRMLKENWGRESRVIYNSHPIPLVGEQKRKPLIMWIGNLRLHKHPERFVELAKTFHDRPYLFTMVGRGMGFPELDETVRSASRELENFEYLGELSPVDIYERLLKTRLLVHTSDYEGFPNVFIEAWIYGVPVVSLTVDPDDLIKTHNLGRVSGRMENLVSDVEELMNDDDKWQILSEKSKTISREKFDIKKNVDLLMEALDRMT